MIRHIAALALTTSLATTSAYASPAEKPLSVVLVHGAFVDGSGWQKVYGLLSKKGYEVLVVQNSTATLDGDVTATTQAIARAKHPVVLVGHSYGGAVITEAGTDPKVHSLVYLAAFAPDTGESVVSILSKPVPGATPAPVLPPKDGALTVDIAKFPKAFAADVDPAVTKFMAASQVPWGVEATGTKLDRIAWKDKPTYYMVATADHMIPPQAERDMAARAHATTTQIASSHAVMLSHPKEVAALIERAADATK